MPLNRQILLASRPAAEITEDNFRLVRVPLGRLAEDQVRVRGHWLSVDPYMRGRMSDQRSYAEPVALGAVMIGDVAGEVVESRHSGFKPGDTVVGTLGWQEYASVEGSQLRRTDTRQIPASAYLGVAGLPGITAYIGLQDHCDPQPGETVVVSAAAGAVGGVAGQLAKLRGCRVVGIAGGAEKCRYVVDDLGFDACVDYKAEDFRRALRANLPDGVDVVFENVGGEVLDAVLAHLRPSARIALCGAISAANGRESGGIKRLLSLIVNRVRLHGFIVTDHPERWGAAVTALSALAAEGRLRCRESIRDGLEQAPRALIGLFEGCNIGKQLVRLG